MGSDPIYLNDIEQRGLLVKKEVGPRHSLLSRHQWMGGGINGVNKRNKRGLTPIYQFRLIGFAIKNSVTASSGMACAKAGSFYTQVTTATLKYLVSAIDHIKINMSDLRRL
jgi:hypothetical protein